MPGEKYIADPISPLSGIDGQLMIAAAVRYCLGRQSYIVPACIDWLVRWWGKVESQTAMGIVRDIVEALQQGTAETEWKDFAQWAWDKMPEADRSEIKQAVAWRQKPWPLFEEFGPMPTTDALGGARVAGGAALSTIAPSR